jgi:hypothetical protein
VLTLGAVSPAPIILQQVLYSIGGICQEPNPTVRNTGMLKEIKFKKN